MACFPVVGDLQLTADNTRFVVATGLAATAQRITVGLQTLRLTWRWDLTVGVPLFDQEKLTIPVLKAFLIQFLRSFPEVSNVKSVNIAVTGNTANADYVVQVRNQGTLQSSVSFPVVG